MKLTDTACKNAKGKAQTYKLADGQGLYLSVEPNGSKYWRLKYRIGDKERKLSIGVYPEITLLKAREKRAEARALLQEGVDPSAAKKRKKLRTVLGDSNTFEAIAREWLDNQKDVMTPRYHHYVTRRLEKDVFSRIGQMPINELLAPDLLAVFKAIEKRGARTLPGRLRQTCGQIFRYGIATGRCDRNPAVDLKGSLRASKIKHFKNLEEPDLTEFLEKLFVYDTLYGGEYQTKLAFKLIILTMVRTGELIGALWSEVDFEKKEWHIKAERMKMREKHIVPLSEQSFQILKELREMNEFSEFIFPSPDKGNQHISNGTLLNALYRMGYRHKATVHGFRATASTILNEKGFRRDVIERQLSHGERNKVRAAYNHAQYLPERREMLQWWADHLDKLAAHMLKKAAV